MCIDISVINNIYTNKNGQFEHNDETARFPYLFWGVTLAMGDLDIISAPSRIYKNDIPYNLSCMSDRSDTLHTARKATARCCYQSLLLYEPTLCLTKSRNEILIKRSKLISLMIYENVLIQLLISVTGTLNKPIPV